MQLNKREISYQTREKNAANYRANDGGDDSRRRLKRNYLYILGE